MVCGCFHIAVQQQLWQRHSGLQSLEYVPSRPLLKSKLLAPALEFNKVNLSFITVYFLGIYCFMTNVGTIQQHNSVYSLLPLCPWDHVVLFLFLLNQSTICNIYIHILGCISQENPNTLCISSFSWSIKRFLTFISQQFDYDVSGRGSLYLGLLGVHRASQISELKSFISFGKFCHYSPRYIYHPIISFLFQASSYLCTRPVDIAPQILNIFLVFLRSHFFFKFSVIAIGLSSSLLFFFWVQSAIIPIKFSCL